MKHITTIILFWAGLSAVWAQQAPQYSLFALNPYAYNPAFAGLENTLIATGVYRRQWSGLEGAPETQHVNAHLPLSAWHSGVGIKIENDVIGAHRTTQGSAAFNYQLEVGRNTVLSAGFGVGFLQYSLDGAKLRTPEGVYPSSGSGTFSHNDPNLPEGAVSAGTTVIEAGLCLQSEGLVVGAAIQPVFAPLLTAPSEDKKNSFSIKAVPHYLLHGAYHFHLNQSLEFNPSVMVKTDLKKTQAEISAIFRWRENIFGGASFRGFGNKSREAASILGGFRLNEKTTLGYAFDIPLAPLSNVQRGSHELLLRYSLNKPVGAGKLPPVIYNPRFL